MLKLNVFVLFVTLFLLGGCGGGGGGTPDRQQRPTGSAVGVVQHGPVRNAIIRAYEWTGTRGELVAETQTDGNGEYTLPISYKDTYLLLTSEGGDYVEEASGRTVSMGTDQLSTIVYYKSGAANVSAQLTFFTTLATCYAEYLVAQGSRYEDAIPLAVDMMAGYAGVPIIATRPVDVTRADSFTTQLTTPHKYGMILAGISEALEALRVKDNAPEDALAYTSKYLTSLACFDIKSDGLLDGLGTATEGSQVGQLYLGTTPLDVDFFRKNIGAGILAFASNENNKAGMSASEMLEVANFVSQNSVPLFNDRPGSPVDTQGPIITNQLAERSLFRGVVSIPFTITDQVGLGDRVTFYMVTEGGDVELGSAASSDAALQIDTGAYPEGSYTIKVVAKDALGNVSEEEFSYTFVSSGPSVNIKSSTLVNDQSYLAHGELVESLAEVASVVVNDTPAQIVRDEAGWLTWSAQLHLILDLMT